MSNQNKMTPLDDADISEILKTEQKFYRSCKHSDKLRRFTYTNWCPICEADSSRRRSKSETLETFENNAFRKRLRDTMKTPSPKKEASSENHGSYGVGDARNFLEASRLLRANLCELPTTYINNCQPQLSPEKMGGFGGADPVAKLNGIARLHYMAPEAQIENRARDAIKFNEAFYHEAYKSLAPTKNMINRMGGANGARLTPRLEEFPPAAPSKAAPVEERREREDFGGKRMLPTPRPSRKAEAYQLPVRPKTCTIEQMRSDNYHKFKPNDVAKHKSDSGVVTDAKPHLKSCYVIECQANQKSLPPPPRDAPSIKTPGKALPKASVKTPTKTPPTLIKTKSPPVAVVIPEVPLRKEEPETPKTPKSTGVEAVERQRHRVRPRSDSDNAAGVPDNPEQTKKAREVSPPQSQHQETPEGEASPLLEPQPQVQPQTHPLLQKKELRAKSAVKLASIKNRHKISVTKLRKVRNKIAHSVSSDSNLSGSDFEYADAEEPAACEAITPEAGGSTPTHKITAVVVPDHGALAEYANWPLRASLFAHVPPYVRFAAHDAPATSLAVGANRHLKWRLSNITPIVVRKTLSNTGFRLVRNSNDWTGTWGKHIKSIVFQTLKDNQKLNHFPGTFQIGRKDRLWKNLQRLMFKFGMKEFGFIPRTFVLPHDLKMLRHAWEKTGADRWIIKPPASARGTGIRVIHRWAHLPKKKSLVVQQYIANPYLINGSKFDLRLYVLVTSFNPLRVYLYPEGLARFASTKYSDDVSTLSDRYMHLTNYSINKLSSHYAANEDANACKGHKWTLSKLWEYLEKEGVDTRHLWRSLQQLVIKTMLCGESSITQLYKQHVNSRYNCYELFGVDVLLDERLKAWLLEVNISPSLHSASPLDLHVKGPLVQALLNLAQFHLSPKTSRAPNSPPVLDANLYTVQLTTQERLKHLHFTEFEKRDDYLTEILRTLTGDDVRHLLTAEDELTVIGAFERIFPTQHTHVYFQFMEPRYYNRLFDAWEHRYEKNRAPGIKILQHLCEKKIHLDVPPISVKKSSDEESTTVSTTSEVTSSSEDISKPQTPPPPVRRPQTSPIPVLVDPTIK